LLLVWDTQSIRKCTKCWESMRKYTKCWESMIKCTKEWERIRKYEKVWEIRESMRKYGKVCCKLGKKCAKSFTPKKYI